MKKFYIIANWKMRLNFKESIDLFNAIKQGLPEKNKAEIVICPSYIPLSEINKNNDCPNFQKIVCEKCEELKKHNTKQKTTSGSGTLGHHYKETKTYHYDKK